MTTDRLAACIAAIDTAEPLTPGEQPHTFVSPAEWRAIAALIGAVRDLLDATPAPAPTAAPVRRFVGEGEHLFDCGWKTGVDCDCPGKAAPAPAAGVDAAAFPDDWSDADAERLWKAVSGALCDAGDIFFDGGDVASMREGLDHIVEVYRQVRAEQPAGGDDWTAADVADAKARGEKYGALMGAQVPCPCGCGAYAAEATPAGGPGEVGDRARYHVTYERAAARPDVPFNERDIAREHVDGIIAVVALVRADLRAALVSDGAVEAADLAYQREEARWPATRAALRAAFDCAVGAVPVRPDDGWRDEAADWRATADRLRTQRNEARTALAAERKAHGETMAAWQTSLASLSALDTATKRAEEAEATIDTLRQRRDEERRAHKALADAVSAIAQTFGADPPMVDDALATLRGLRKERDALAERLGRVVAAVRPLQEAVDRLVEAPGELGGAGVKWRDIEVTREEHEACEAIIVASAALSGAIADAPAAPVGARVRVYPDGCGPDDTSCDAEAGGNRCYREPGHDGPHKAVDVEGRATFTWGAEPAPLPDRRHTRAGVLRCRDRSGTTQCQGNEGHVGPHSASDGVGVMSWGADPPPAAEPARGCPVPVETFTRWSDEGAALADVDKVAQVVAWLAVERLDRDAGRDGR